MMRYKILILVIAILALGLSSAYAGNENRIGTAGAQELRIPVGSRGVAMGGSVVANSEGVEAIYWNPAGLARLVDGTEVMFTHQPYWADIDIEYFAVGHDIEDFGTIGAAIKVINIGDIEETTYDEPDGTGAIFSPTFVTMGLTYARAVTADVNFGVTANVVHESIGGVTASGLAFDFGFTYRTRLDGLMLGFAMKNYGPDIKFSGNGFNLKLEDSKYPVQSENASSELPTSINLGAAYNFLNDGKNSVTACGNFRANNQTNDAVVGGVEYGYDNTYFLRAGYTHSRQDSYLYGASLGAGVAFSVGGAEFSLEYTWTQVDVFDDNQYFTLKARL